MKCALVLDKDAGERGRLSHFLQLLGYLTAAVRTPNQALNVASAIRFDLIVTDTDARVADRRHLAAELKRSAPGATLIFAATNANEYRHAKAGSIPCVNAVVRRPASMESLRRILQFGIDGTGLQLDCSSPFLERRRRST
ncbi:response regulator [Massilia oculi]|uniref:Response regulator n=1 Tax=Massilia hydrophila TaxID=3044279 RepID=A0ABS7Y9Z5_9BURK|nr:response regulator [Massilia oculi]MCA1855215.1 response regulator [Massilia oculi]